MTEITLRLAFLYTLCTTVLVLLINPVQAQLEIETTTDPNATTVASTLPTTTYPPDPGEIFIIIIPVAILVGIPLVIVSILCCGSMISGCKKAKESHQQNRRVTPINGLPADVEDGNGGTRIHSVSIPQDELITYDGNYNGGREGGLETQPQYNYGWDF